MKIKSQATVMGMSLVIVFEGESWYLSVRRLDDNPDSLFFEFDNKELTSKELQLFMPSDIEWIKLPEKFFSKCEYVSKSCIYKINLVGNSNKIESGKLPLIFEEVYKKLTTY